MSEEIYKSARLARDLDPDAVEIEKFGALVRLATSGALKSKGGMKAVGAAKKAKTALGGMSTGAKVGTAAAGSGLGGLAIGSQFGKKLLYPGGLGREAHQAAVKAKRAGWARAKSQADLSRHGARKPPSAQPQTQRPYDPQKAKNRYLADRNNWVF